jgi:hypothetical protein
MRLTIAAALALTTTATLDAQTIADLSTATPITGDWIYASASDGSEAQFANATGSPQLWMHCTRATRRVSIAKPVSAAAPFLNLWTSALTRSVPASFNPAIGRLTIELDANDALFDGIANSRGRFGIAAGTQPPLVVPAWPEAARVIEDCRS